MSFASSGARERATADALAGRARAALVALDLGQGGFADSVEEHALLARTAGADVAVRVTAKRGAPDPSLFVGSGKAEEIAALVKEQALDLVLVNHALSPAQQRNLERVLGVRVVDRTSLILDIFAQRAKSHEGKIQVELAQLRHLSTRLVRSWTHLERQRGAKGGIGLRGPGETQLETDRRLIGDRVKLLRGRLDRLQAQRRTQRRSRERRGTFSVALVGYTNAGKSTLFNALAKADAYAADQLFATLDTTSRRVWFEGAGTVVLSDTVGFIRELPHQLVESFKATLEETVHADLLLHVIDSASPARHEQIEAVNAVLREIGADGIPQIEVYNKCDASGLQPEVRRDPSDMIVRVVLSAREGSGLDLLRAAIVERANGSAPHSEAQPDGDETSDPRGAASQFVHHQQRP